MNRSSISASGKICKSLFGAFTFFVLFAAGFTSCENFLKSEDVKQDIVNTIEYNNAPSYTINVETIDNDKCGKVKTPATGEIIKKVTDVFPVRFEPADGYTFQGWEVVIKDLQPGEEPSNYIVFEDPYALETNVTFKKASAKTIIIHPVCPPKLTYSFTQGGGEIYPRDSSPEFTFNQPLAEECFSIPVNVENYITVSNLEEQYVSQYFSSPKVNGQKLIFRSDSTNGYISIANNAQRSINVKIPKDKIWYINNQYLRPIKVTLDEDIKQTFLIGAETSAKTRIKYELKKDAEEKNIGNFKIDGEDIVNKEYPYSVGQSVSLRYKLPDGYTFAGWKFKKSDGTDVSLEDLSFTFSENENANNLVQTTFIVENYISDVITFIPDIYEPVKFSFSKTTGDTGTFKVDSTPITQEDQGLLYGVQSSFDLSYKVPSGYTFYGWSYSRTYKDDKGATQTEFLSKELLKDKCGIDVTFETNEDGSENGFDVITRLAQAQVTINEYSDNLISINPICFQNLEITAFSLNDANKQYSRDSELVFTFTKPIAAACKNAYTIKIPGIEEEKSFSDYFEASVLNQNTLAIKAKNENADQLIPLLATGINTISFSFDAQSIYYEVQTPLGENIKIYLSSNLYYSYKINNETNKKSKIQFVIDNQDAGTFLVDGEYKNSNSNEYSIGKPISVRYKINDDFVFNGWEFSLTDSIGNVTNYNIGDDEFDDLSLKLSFDAFQNEYGYDRVNGIITANITPLSQINETIKIHPVIVEAPSTSVTISGNRGSFSPSSGSFNIKQNFSNTISFEPESNFEFIRWEVYDTNTNTALDSEQRYIFIEDVYSKSITYKLIQIPEGNNTQNSGEGDDDDENNVPAIGLGIRPILAPRPKVISNSPLNTGNVLRDNTIQVIFDNDMDKNSVYYTEPELREKRAELGIAYNADSVAGGNENPKPNRLLWFLDANGQKVYYGYVKDGETYFKNIYIKNRQSGENLLSCFEPPLFERNDTLSIGIQRSVTVNNGVTTTESLIPKYAQIIVTIGDDSTGDNVFYSVDNKPVKMASSFAWYYQVSDKSDVEAPIIATDGEPVVSIGTDALTSSTTVPAASNKTEIASLSHFNNGKFNLKLKIDDKANGSGVAPSFTVICQKVYDASYASLSNGETKAIGIEYSYVAGQTADFDGECSLGNLTDGVYSMKFEFTDKSGNKLSYPTTGAYYFCIDKTGPTNAQDSMTAATVINENQKVKLTWNVKDIKDYDYTIIHYKKYSASGEQPTVTIENQTPDSSGNIVYEFTTLTPGTRYMFYAIHYDVWGNRVQQRYWVDAYTIPAAPKNVNVDTSIYGTTAKLTITKPELGNCTGYEIRYGPTGTAESSWQLKEVTNVSANEINQDITGLSNGVKYEFAVRVKDSSSGFTGITPYKSENKYPVYSTIPAAPDFEGLPVYSSNENSVDYGYTTPDSPFTQLRLYYDTDYSFSHKTYKVISDSSQNHSSTYSVTGLTAGTQYYFKLMAYFETEENKSETGSDWCITKPKPVASFTKDTITTNSVVLNWTKPQSGGYHGYRIYYKKSTDTNYPSTPQVTINDKSTVTYTLTGLEGGTTYNIKIKTFYYRSSSSSVESVDSSIVTAQTYPNPVTNLVAQNLTTTSTKLTWISPAGMCDDLYLYISANENFTDLIKSTKLSAGATSYTATGLTTGSTYYYKLYSRVYKYNDSTSLIYTESDTVICSTSINPVTNQKVSSYGVDSITVNWSNPAEYDGIRIYTSSNSTFSTTNSTLKATYTNKTTTSSTISNLSPNTYYYVYIVAYKMVDGSEKTAVVRLGQRTLASLVQSISAEVKSPTSVEVTWKNPASSSNWNYSRLYVYQGSNYVTYYSLSKETQNTSQSYTVSELTPGTSYTFSVRTYNDSGDVNNSYSSVTTTTTPAPVTNFRVTSTTTTGPTLEWTLPEGNFTGLTIYRKTDSGAWTKSATIGGKTQTSITYDNSSVFTAGKDYVFKITTNLTGVTNLSDGSSETGTVTAHIRPNAPTGLACSSRTTSSIKVIWTNPENYTGVRLYYKAHTSTYYSYTNITKGVASYEITGLTAGTKYDIYLMSYNYSTTYYSNSSTITTCTTPATVTGLTASASNGGTKISWSASSGNKDYYAVYYKLSSSSSWSLASNTVSPSSTSYTFSNSDLTNNSYYNFKVVGRTYSDSTDFYVESASFNTTSFYAPPAGLSNVSLYSDDGMGTVRIKFYTSSSSTYVDVFVGTTYVAYNYFSGTGYKYITVTIPNYTRGTYTIRIAPYHYNNSKSNDTASWAQEYTGHTYGTSVTQNSRSDGLLVINGTAYSYSNLNRIVNKNSSAIIAYNSRGTDGAFTSNRVVTLNNYSMGAYEVTQQLFKAVMGYNPSAYNYDYAYYPVCNLRWYDAIAFCNKLSALQGLTPCYTISGIQNSWWETATISQGNYTSSSSYIYVPTSDNSNWNNVTLNQNANGYYLPTECQWEYAARGYYSSGNPWEYTYAGSNTLSDVGWYVDNSGGTSHQVGQKSSNYHGLYDLNGNVYEWLSDWNNSVPSGTFTDPWCGNYTSTTTTTIEKNSKNAVLLKGGSFKRGSSYCKNQVNDYYYKPATTDSDRERFGMRLCRHVSY